MMRNDLVNVLRMLSDNQFVEVLYDAVRGRHIYERNIFDAHLVLPTLRATERKGR